MDVVVVEKDLAKHRVFVHPTNNDEKMFQCQSGIF
jgi:hypothetical protein